MVSSCCRSNLHRSFRQVQGLLLKHILYKTNELVKPPETVRFKAPLPDAGIRKTAA